MILQGFWLMRTWILDSDLAVVKFLNIDKIIHCELKPKNIYLSEANNMVSRLILKAGFIDHLRLY